MLPAEIASFFPIGFGKPHQNSGKKQNRKKQNTNHPNKQTNKKHTKQTNKTNPLC